MAEVRLCDGPFDGWCSTFQEGEPEELRFNVMRDGHSIVIVYRRTGDRLYQYAGEEDRAADG